MFFPQNVVFPQLGTRFFFLVGTFFVGGHTRRVSNLGEDTIAPRGEGREWLPVCWTVSGETCVLSVFCVFLFGLNIPIALVCTVTEFFWGWLWGMNATTGAIG